MGCQDDITTNRSLWSLGATGGRCRCGEKELGEKQREEGREKKRKDGEASEQKEGQRRGLLPTSGELKGLIPLHSPQTISFISLVYSLIIASLGFLKLDALQSCTTTSPLSTITSPSSPVTTSKPASRDTTTRRSPTGTSVNSLAPPLLFHDLSNASCLCCISSPTDLLPSPLLPPPTPPCPRPLS